MSYAQRDVMQLERELRATLIAKLLSPSADKDYSELLRFAIDNLGGGGGGVAVATTLLAGKSRVDNDSVGDPQALTALGHGLALDPHPQYALDAHTHAAADIISGVLAAILLPFATTVLRGAALVDNNSGGSPVALTSAGHGAAADPHPQYALDSEKAAALGLATLDAAGDLVATQLPLGVTATTVRAGNDAAYSDSRTPLAHKASHQSGGADQLSVLNLSGLLADAQTPLAHVHPQSDVTGLVAALALKLAAAYVRLTVDNAAIAAAAPTTVLVVAGLVVAMAVNEEWDVEWVLIIANSVAADVFAFNVLPSAGTFTGRYWVEGINGVPAAGAGVPKVSQNPTGTLSLANANAPGNTGTIGLVTVVRIRAVGKQTVAPGNLQVALRAGTNAALTSGTAVVKLQSQVLGARVA